MRNTCPAFDFDAELTIEQSEPHLPVLKWQKGGHTAVLHADLRDFSLTIDADTTQGHFHFQQ